ncbi:MAG: hypothetical protein P8M49_09380 [Thalassotalea sp.]|nr:hypothetical protein [Thalassotalea sp.]MDG2393711.1 hypothetical protein [Thalassotalea sp.]
MRLAIIATILVMASTSVNASNLKSDEMCQTYLSGLTGNIVIAENVGMHAMRLSINRIADTHPEYYELAQEIVFGTALSEEGHRRVGSYINYMCTQDGSVLVDLMYKVLLEESIRITNELNAKP